MKKLFLSLVLSLNLFGCGQATSGPIGSPGTPPPVQDPATSEYVLMVWGAPWCHACHEEIPIMNTAIAKNKKVKGVVYLATGNTSNSIPTEAIATQYKDSLHLTEMEMRLDYPPKWKLNKELLPGSNAIPAAVLMKDGKVFKRFFPTSYLGREVAAYIENL